MSFVVMLLNNIIPIAKRNFPFVLKRALFLAIGNTQLFQKWEISFGVGYIKNGLKFRLFLLVFILIASVASSAFQYRSNYQIPVTVEQESSQDSESEMEDFEKFALLTTWNDFLTFEYFFINTQFFKSPKIIYSRVPTPPPRNVV